MLQAVDHGRERRRPGACNPSAAFWRGPFKIFKPGDRLAPCPGGPEACGSCSLKTTPCSATRCAPALTQDGARVDWVRSLSDARLALVEHDYKAVLLDLGLPEGSGLKVLASMRALTPRPCSSSRARPPERTRRRPGRRRRRHVVKPFQLDDQARLRAVLRRSSNTVVSAMRRGDVAIEPARQIVARRQEVSLSAHEYRTLLALMERMARPSAANSWRWRYMAAAAPSRTIPWRSMSTSCGASSAKA